MESDTEGDRNGRGCGSGDSTRVRPGLGLQLGDAFHRVIGQADDDVDKVCFGIEAGEPAVSLALLIAVWMGFIFPSTGNVRLLPFGGAES
jgi:hypothetical protein